MNRLGFSLLTLGAVLAFLGWHYRDDVFAFPGFLLIAVLAVLAAVWPTFISYEPERESAPMTDWGRRLWGLYYGFAIAMFIAGAMHTGAGGQGEYVILAGLALFLSLSVYDGLHHERFRQARLATLRGFRRWRSLRHSRS
jgi:TRAP-type C4-dicarboxylate transport system permease large subunit